MKITGTRSYIDVEVGERTARFSGELGINGFYAAKNSIHWLSPHESQPILKYPPEQQEQLEWI